MAKLPNLFLVGAPKCGTTSMYAYLKQHPSIFMCEPKEPHFFSDDIHTRRPKQMGEIKDLKQYQELFAGAATSPIAGEASVWYLYSKVAARRIFEFNPHAKILCILRHPVEMAWSMFRFRCQVGQEGTVDIIKALSLESERSKGRHLPAGVNRPCSLQYRAIGRFAEQIQRYFDIWPRNHIHVIFFDDLVKNPQRTVLEAYRFLGVEDMCDVSLEIHNKTHAPEDVNVERIRQGYPVAVAVGRKLLPPLLRRGLGRIVRSKIFGTSVFPDTLPEEAIRILHENYVPDIRRLGVILGKNLDDWIERYSQNVLLQDCLGVEMCKKS